MNGSIHCLKRILYVEREKETFNVICSKLSSDNLSCEKQFVGWKGKAEHFPVLKALPRGKLKGERKSTGKLSERELLLLLFVIHHRITLIQL